MRRTAAPGSFLLVLAAGTTFGCSTEPVVCAPYFAYGLTVNVVDDRTGALICDGVVTAREGSYAETLSAGDPGGGCRFIGAPERAGTYAVRADRTGFVGATVPDVTVVSSGGACPHVRPVTVQIRLVPAT